jgi:hypothetical protein
MAHLLPIIGQTASSKEEGGNINDLKDSYQHIFGCRYTYYWFIGAAACAHGSCTGRGYNIGYGMGSHMGYGPGRTTDGPWKKFDKETANLRNEIYQKRIELRNLPGSSEVDITEAKTLQAEINKLENELPEKRLTAELEFRKENPNRRPDAQSGYGLGHKDLKSAGTSLQHRDRGLSREYESTLFPGLKITLSSYEP